MFTESAEFYDAIYSFKDYVSEANQIAALLRSVRAGAVTVLDVACGTGNMSGCSLSAMGWTSMALTSTPVHRLRSLGETQVDDGDRDQEILRRRVGARGVSSHMFRASSLRLSPAEPPN